MLGENLNGYRAGKKLCKLCTICNTSNQNKQKSNLNEIANFFPIPRYEKAVIVKIANIYLGQFNYAEHWSCGLAPPVE